MNITNTLSAAGSLLADFQVGGSSLVNITKVGQFNLVPGGSPAGIVISSGASAANIWVDTNTTNSLMLSANSLGTANAVQVNGAGLILAVNRGLAWKAGLTVSTGGNGDTGIVRDGTAGVLALLNPDTSTAGTGLRIYNTTDSFGISPTNYERGVFDWTTNANQLTIGSQAGGTGSGRQVILVSAGLYSAAGVALPACAAGIKGAQAVVSDATAPTYNANYASGGAVVAHVVCNGANWVTQ
jgi:hypothetical protein